MRGIAWRGCVAQPRRCVHCHLLSLHKRHVHANVHRVPVPPVYSTFETIARKWQQTPTNPNRPDADTNLGLAFALLRAVHAQEMQNNAELTHNKNILLNPVAIAQKMQTNEGFLREMRESLGGDGELIDKYLQVDYQQIEKNLISANNDFARWESLKASATGAGAEDADHHDTLSASSSSSTFTGFLAPRWAITKTVSPSWFIPTPSPQQIQSFEQTPKHHSVYTPKPQQTLVTPLERSIRYPGAMIYHTRPRLYYVESQYAQMVDLPYLHQDYSLTVIVPRFSEQMTLNNHPNKHLVNLLRDRSDINALINTLNTRWFQHHLQYTALLPGVVVLPCFDAKYTYDTHTASLSISNAGLQKGGLTVIQPKYSAPLTRFLFSAHRPFVIVLRHRSTNTVLMIGKIEHVQRDDSVYLYPRRLTQWLEDYEPIVQFDEHQWMSNDDKKARYQHLLDQIPADKLTPQQAQERKERQQRDQEELERQKQQQKQRQQQLLLQQQQQQQQQHKHKPHTTATVVKPAAALPAKAAQRQHPAGPKSTKAAPQPKKK